MWLRLSTILFASLLLAACGSSGSGGEADSISIRSAEVVEYDGDPLKSAEFNESNDKFMVTWRVSASNPSNLYRVELHAISDETSQGVLIAGQNCAAKGEAGFYDCNEQGSLSCSLSEGTLLTCRVAGHDRGALLDGGLHRLVFTACMYDSNMNYPCQTRELNVTVSATKRVAPTTGDSTGGGSSGDDSSGGDGSGDGSGGDSSGGDGSGDGTSGDGSSGGGGSTDDGMDDEASSETVVDSAPQPIETTGESLLPPGIPALDI